MRVVMGDSDRVYLERVANVNSCIQEDLVLV